MKLETLSLRGLTRFTDAIALDLRDLPSGLIAFTGANGEGKTTGLEAGFAGLYRFFPSRDRELLDYATRTDAYIDQTFELEGQGLYRARLNLDGPHRKSEGILSRLLPDGTAAILNDGRVTTFDAEVRKLLPPPELLLASVFAAQNRAGSFISLDRKTRKQLFATLLGLDHYEQMAERAKTAAALVQQTVDTLHARRELLARDASDDVAEALEQQAQALQVEGGQIEATRAELSRDLAALEQQLTALADAAAAYAAARARADRNALDHAKTQADLTATERALATHDRDAVLELGAEDRRLAQALDAIDRDLASTAARDADLRQIQQDLDATIADADERIANNRKLLADAAVIRAAVDEVRAIEAVLATLRAEIQAAQEDAQRLRARERALADSLGAIQLAQGELARAEQDASLTDGVPCHGADTYAGCQFLTNAATAKAKIPALRKVVAGKRQTEEDLREVRDELAALGKATIQRQQRVSTHEAERQTSKAKADRLPQLTAAEEKIRSHEQRKREAAATATRLQHDAEQRHLARQADLATRRKATEAEGQTRHNDLVQRATVRRRELEDAISALRAAGAQLDGERATIDAELARTQDASEQANALTITLQLRRRAWDETTAGLARVQSQRAELERQRATFTARRAELSDLDARAARLVEDLLDWQLLQRAFGRDGLQVLEIDAAGPTVAAYTNDLLQVCYGSRFSVDLITQEAKRSKGKDGSTMKDAFELLVFDADRGGEPRDLSDLSGGEKVIVDEALKSAIALLVNTRNQHPIRTCWRDETTGALDGDNALRYMAMLRRVHQLGGFHQTLFITHNPEAARLADAQVRFAGGQLEILLPPYAEAA